jgi:integrase
LSRRTGQNGSVFQRDGGAWDPTKTAFGRFYVDTPEGRKREKISLGLCKTKSIAKALLKQHMDREGINDPLGFHQNTAPAVTFREQAEFWLKQLAQRRRNPVKPATLYGYRSILNAQLLPLLGDVPLREVDNSAWKMVNAKMHEAGLSAKSVVNYTKLIKPIVASARTDKGDQIYPRQWDPEFADLPTIEKGSQYRPTITTSQIESTLLLLSARERVLVGLLAATGLRIGEPLALRPDDFSSDCRLVRIERSNWRGKDQEPKTPNAVREIDIPSAFAAVLRDFIKGKNGYLFATRSGRPLSQRNALRSLHAVGLLGGFHMFRRFRMEVLRKNHCPRDLETFWMGHASQTVGDIYALGIRNDTEWRQVEAERIGLGFNWATVGHKVVEIPASNAA